MLLAFQCHLKWVLKSVPKIKIAYSQNYPGKSLRKTQHKRSVYCLSISSAQPVFPPAMKQMAGSVSKPDEEVGGGWVRCCMKNPYCIFRLWMPWGTCAPMPTRACTHTHTHTHTHTSKQLCPKSHTQTWSFHVQTRLKLCWFSMGIGWCSMSHLHDGVILFKNKF